MISMLDRYGSDQLELESFKLTTPQSPLREYLISIALKIRVDSMASVELLA